MPERIDIKEKYGRWSVLEELPPLVTASGSVHRQIRVRCECGTEGTRKIYPLVSGKSLGCRQCARRLLPRIGDTFGDLTVVEVGITTPGRETRHIRVRCRCGTERVLAPAVVISGNHKSCGCRKFRLKDKNPKWGGYGEISGEFFGHIRNSAKKRGIPFEVTKEEVWALAEKQGHKCAITGWPLTYPRRQHDTKTASLDRIDPALPYRLDNVHWVHKAVNLAKRDSSLEDFLVMCRAAVTYAAT